MVIALATVAAAWRLETVPGHIPRPKLAITMPVDALPMIPRRRVRPSVVTREHVLTEGARHGN
jgi:pentalenene oxygenase